MCGGWTGLPGRHHPANHTPVLLFQLNKTREGRLHTHLLRISRIDAGHQGLEHPLEGLATNTPPEESRQRFIPLRPLRRHRQIQPHPREPCPTQQSAPEKGPQLAGNDDHQSFGELMQTATREDTGPFAGLVGVDELIGQPQFGAEFKAGRFLRQEGIGARLRHETRRPDG